MSFPRAVTMNSAHAAPSIFRTWRCCGCRWRAGDWNGDRFRFVSALNALTVHYAHEPPPLGIKVNAAPALELQDPAARVRVWPVSVPLHPRASSFL